MKKIVSSLRLFMALIAAFLMVSFHESANGTVIDLGDYAGKVVVVEFWASWCIPCRRSFPWLDSMQNKYHLQGLEVIGVNMDADPSAAASFLQEYEAALHAVLSQTETVAAKP